MSGFLRGQQDTCPHLGLHWDRSIRALYPDLANRCFAGFRRVSFLWLFTRRRLGAPVDLAYQDTTCYADFGRCEVFQNERASRRERPAGACRGG